MKFYQTLIAFFLFGFLVSCEKRTSKENIAENLKDSIESLSGSEDFYAEKDSLEWVCLSNNEWMPVSGNILHYLKEARVCYLRKDYKKTVSYFEKTSEMLRKITFIPEAKDQVEEINKSSKDLKSFAEKIENKEVELEEFDSILQKICDITNKNCWIQLDLDVWIEESEYNKRTNKVFESLAKGDSAATTEELKKIRSLVKVDSKKFCDPEGKSLINKAVVEMEILVDGIEKGTLKSVKTTKKSFSKVFFALAFNYYVKANQGIVEGIPSQKLGKEIIAAATFMEKGAKWSDHPLNSYEINALNEAKKLGKELKEEKIFISEQIKAAVEEMGIIIIEHKPDKTIIKEGSDFVI